ncbi:carrier protein, putative (macronuclear) [Tetrahymena thermophila SB210]|uniref:Carrier protein, putative n=1 Tax=Tetrahymena thermophila (strain SB210) TaxID=312017 RepID=Q22NC9_TETTS|nr:carrier protein, putative [Tetrahymena thermophila SB210]EAR86856.1 carrier protein, putative [Tetrahymena thermophila SB210]|eukprot:XP_001007101.1 carrier protein, putative [Tetrahymena thermophila SB210]
MEGEELKQQELKVKKFIRKSRFTKRKERRQKLSQEAQAHKQKISEIRHLEKDFICAICLQYICCSTSTKCGHAFCETCLTEYELLFDKCLVCDSSIKNQEIRSCFLLDNLIQEFIERNHPSELQNFNKRKAECIQQRQKKQISDWQIGMKIDIRDSNNIWCVGIISRIQPNKNNQAQNIVVCYVNNLNIQEELPCASSRLAPFGLYSSRKDIPHYNNCQNTSEIVIHLPTLSDNVPQKLFIQ